MIRRQTFDVTLPRILSIEIAARLAHPALLHRICRISPDVLNKMDEGRLQPGVLSRLSKHHLSGRHHIPLHGIGDQLAGL